MCLRFKINDLFYFILINALIELPMLCHFIKIIVS